MQFKPWRVIWYDADDHEIDSADFLQENDASRAMDRVCRERQGHSVELNKARQTAEAAAHGYAHDGWEQIRKTGCQ